MMALTHACTSLFAEKENTYRDCTDYPELSGDGCREDSAGNIYCECSDAYCNRAGVSQATWLSIAAALVTVFSLYK